tara:strand:+ start:199 stop:444 length:246 start_codon:yes stop_codon:yes gene_type:complete
MVFFLLLDDALLEDLLPLGLGPIDLEELLPCPRTAPELLALPDDESSGARSSITLSSSSLSFFAVRGRRLLVSDGTKGFWY